MTQGFDEMMALYQASVKKSPALMMENIQVDSNRGVTSRGNSPYDKFASPATRAKVLESRLQEIDAFAQNRKIPTSAVYAAAEAAMRTGKIPDLGQFGMAGDDAVATKQFLISNVLNIAGLEWKDYKGDPVTEQDLRPSVEPGAAPAEPKGKSRSKRPRTTAGGFQMDDVAVDPMQFMTEGSGGQRALGRKLVGTDKTGDWRKTMDVEQRMKQRNVARPPGANERLAMLAHGKGVAPGREEKVPPRSGPGWGGLEQDVPRSTEKLKQMRQQSDVSVDPSRFMAEGSGQEGMRKGTQSHTGEWGRARGGRPDSGRIDVSKLNVGRARSRREGQAQGKAGLADYQAGKEQQQQSSVSIDPARFMSEEGGPYRTGGGPESAPLSPTRMSDGGSALAKPQNYERHDLLPKEIMNKLKQALGDRVHGLTRAELFDIARERGLLGTEEDVAGAGELQEHDFRFTAQKHGGKFVRYIQGNVGVYDFPSEKQAVDFAGFFSSKTTASPKVDGKRVFINEPVMGESAHLGASAHGGTSGGLSPLPGPTDAPPTNKRAASRLAELSRTKAEDSEDDSVEAEIRRYSIPSSVSDKILGIEPGDPRAESWPKLSDEMRQLLNLESAGVLRGPRGFNMPEPPSEEITEATVAGGLGGFIGAGLGGGLSMRTTERPSYDASYELPDDPAERVKVLKKMLSAHGLKDVKEDETSKHANLTAASESVPAPQTECAKQAVDPLSFMKVTPRG